MLSAAKVADLKKSPSNSALFSSEFDDGESSDSEDADEYRRGGYHWVRVGDVYHERFVMHRKLGWGQFSTVWLATDVTASYESQNKVLAVKIMKSASEYFEAAQDEIDLLQKIAKAPDGPGKNYIVQMISNFELYGPHGTHLCIALELMGRSLLSYLRKSEDGLPIKTVKRLTFQMALSLHFLHDVTHIIHTDIKPENFLLSRRHPVDAKSLEAATIDRLKAQKRDSFPLRQDNRISAASLKAMLKENDGIEVSGMGEGKDNSFSGSPRGMASKIDEDSAFPEPVDLTRQTSTSTINTEDAEIKLCDLGNSCQEGHVHSRIISTRQYRSPEVIIGAEVGTKTDMWSLGCLVFELLTGDYCFDPKESANVTRDEHHLQLMMECLGEIPKEFINEGKYCAEYFTKEGELLHTKVYGHWGLHLLLNRRYGLAEEDAKSAASVLESLMKFDPSERWSALDLVTSEWLRDEYKKSGVSLSPSDCLAHAKI
mmetsp:Transcript_28279/g.39318  ORF Transcript_28279/g.39318 Transcript_28279/m.39318 type:complete len:485 (-) Transcript_28279:51-1505(-)